MPYIKKFIGRYENKRAFEILKNLGYSMGEAQRLIDRKRLYLGDILIKQKNLPVCGDVFLIDYECEPRGLRPVFEHSDFAIFDKPSGVLSHPNGRHCEYSLCDEIWSLYGRNSAVTHRLDFETSGLIIASKNLKSGNSLKSMFEKKEINKAYFALVSGKIDRNFTINLPIGNSYEDDEIGIIMRIRDDGKEAITEIYPVKYYENLNATLVKALPKTGRQHQIRLHLFHMKHRIFGDPLYGLETKIVEDIMDNKLSPEERKKFSGASRLCLHAAELNFEYNAEKFCIKTEVDFEREFLNSL